MQGFFRIFAAEKSQILQKFVSMLNKKVIKMAIDISKYDNLALVLEKDEIQNIMRIVSEMNTFGKNETKPISRCVEVALSMIEQCERIPRVFVGDEIKAPHFLPSPTSQSVITLCEDVYDDSEYGKENETECKYVDQRGIWKEMEEHPRYAISFDFRIKNVESGRMLTTTRRGNCIYCLVTEGGKPHKINVSKLAEKYFPKEKEAEYDYSSETWKQIEGFCMYEVSDMGRVRDFDEKMTEIKISESGDSVVTMTDDEGMDKTVAVRYLVANAFIPDKFGYKYVVNRDGNAKDNRLSNIMRVSELPKVEKRSFGKPKKVQRRKLGRMGFGVIVNEREWFENSTLAAKRIGVTQPAIKYHLDNGKPFRNGATVRKATEMEYEKKGVC